MGKIYTLIWLFFFLLANVKKNETILVYHSLSIMLPVYLAKLIKRNKVILEVEEIYGEVWKTNHILIHLERKLLQFGDYYIFVSEALREKISIKKESIILYGSYEKIDDKLYKVKKEKKENIKIVYAGSIDKTKGGAYRSIDIIKYLPKNYELHILGYGNKAQIEQLNQRIASTNFELNREACKYIGTLYEEEYTKYLLNCDLALNPQNMGDYMNSAFPSKIISYLAHNLVVVSTKLIGIEKSPLKRYIFQVDSSNPEEFAREIKNIELSKIKGNKHVINNLDTQFIYDLNNLLKK